MVQATGLAGGDLRGAGDNGDGSRLYCGAGLVPATPNGQSAWQSGVVVDYTVGPVCPDPIPSSALVILQAAVGGTPVGTKFSLTTLGWFYVGAVAAATALAAWLTTTRSRWRVLYLVPALLPLASPDFSRFFISTYGEPAGLLGTYLLLAGLAAVVATHRTDRVTRAVAMLLVAGGGLVAITAKVAYAPVLLAAVGILLFTPLALAERAKPWTARVIGPVLALTVVIAGVPAVQSAVDWQARNYRDGNVHNLIFTAVLPEIPGAAAELGLPAAAEQFAGVPIQISPLDKPGRDEILADPEGFRRAAVGVLLSNPDVLVRGLGLAVQATQGSDLSYITDQAWPEQASQQPQPADVKTLRDGQQSASTESMQYWLEQMRLPWLPSVLIVLGLFALVGGLLRRRGAAAHFWIIAGVSSATALGLAALALADGYFELAKHVWLASYLVEVTAWSLIGGVLGLLVLSVRRKGRQARAAHAA